MRRIARLIIATAALASAALPVAAAPPGQTVEALRVTPDDRTEVMFS